MRGWRRDHDGIFLFRRVDERDGMGVEGDGSPSNAERSRSLGAVFSISDDGMSDGR